MKRMIVLLLILALLLPLGACGREEKELEPWAMPTVDTKPTPVPTPTISFGGGSPTSYVWNEAAFFNMADPGAAPGSRQETFTHRQSAALFPYNFLPASIFGESHLPYAKLTLQKTQHEVMLDADGQLAEHAYVEYTYLPKNGKPDQALYVMAELCSYDAAMAVYNGAWAHFVMPEGVRMQRSTYYLKDFVLAKIGEQRAAQMLKLTPSSYFSDALRAMSDDGSYVPARQILLTVTCGLGMSDEEFIAAVCALLAYSDGSEIPTPEPSRLPVFGEKGAA